MTGPAHEPTHRRGAAVAERVLTTTLELLAEQGYEFSVEEVAERAEVHKTTIYRRWPTKPSLVGAAVDLLAARTVAASGPDLTDADPVDALRDLIVQVARALRRPAGVNALRAALTSAGADPELSAMAGRFLSSRYQVVVPLVEAAQARGMLRADLDPVLFWQAVVNPLHLNAVTGGPLDDATARALIDLVIRGARS